MALVATFVTRFKITLVPMVLFLAFVSFRIKKTPGTTAKEYMVPALLILGLTLMHFGRSTIVPESETDTPIISTSTWLFFFGKLDIFCVKQKAQLKSIKFRFSYTSSN